MTKEHQEMWRTFFDVMKEKRKKFFESFTNETEKRVVDYIDRKLYTVVVEQLNLAPKELVLKVLESVTSDIREQVDLEQKIGKFEQPTLADLFAGATEDDPDDGLGINLNEIPPGERPN